MIYVVEDNPEIRELEIYTLKNSGWQAEGFADRASFLDAVAKKVPELVILDIMLPDASGIDILKKLRTDRATANVPVIMVTAKATEADKIKGFDYGADDYISKPFSLIEFAARVRAVLRRSKAPQGEETLSLGPVELNVESRVAKVDGTICELTYKEFELLSMLVKHPDRVFTRDILMNEVWGLDFIGESRTVDMHIKTLRKKLGKGGTLIKTVRNVGYKISL